MTDIQFQIDKWTRYHHEMAGWHDGVNIILLILLCAAIAASVVIPPWGGLAAIVVFSIFTLMSPWQKAHRHMMLHARFSALMMKTIEQESDMEACQDRLLLLELDGPEIYCAQLALAENDTRYARGETQGMIAVSTWQKLTRCIFRHATASFRREMA